MANRRFVSQFSYSFEKQMVKLAASFTQSAGPVFSSSSPLAGMSMERDSAGVYTITLSDKYDALIGCSIMLQRDSGAVDLAPQIASEDVSGAKTITIRMLAGATPTDMANGDILYIELTLRNK